MLRAQIRELADFDYDDEARDGPLTIRDVVEWYKTVVRSDHTATLTVEEREYLNTQWGSLMRTLADVQGVPVGWLSASVAELVQHELRLLATAEAELEGAIDGSQAG